MAKSYVKPSDAHIRRLGPIASSSRLEVEANLPGNNDENNDSTRSNPGVLSFESMPFQISPGFHSQITGGAFTPAAVTGIHNTWCPAKCASAGL